MRIISDVYPHVSSREKNRSIVLPWKKINKNTYVYIIFVRVDVKHVNTTIVARGHFTLRLGNIYFFFFISQNKKKKNPPERTRKKYIAQYYAEWYLQWYRDNYTNKTAEVHSSAMRLGKYCLISMHTYNASKRAFVGVARGCITHVPSKWILWSS